MLYIIIIRSVVLKPFKIGVHSRSHKKLYAHYIKIAYKCVIIKSNIIENK